MTMIIKGKEKIICLCSQRPGRHYSHLADEETEAQGREMASVGCSSVSVAVSGPHSGFLRLQALCLSHWLCSQTAWQAEWSQHPLKSPPHCCAATCLLVHGLPHTPPKRLSPQNCCGTPSGPLANVTFRPVWGTVLLSIGSSGKLEPYWASLLFDRWGN